MTEDNHRTRWTAQEVALLESTYGTMPATTVADIFGRTPAAVRTKHYELHTGSAPLAPLSKDMPANRSYFTATMANHHYHTTAAVCSRCHLEVPTTGHCDSCD